MFGIGGGSCDVAHSTDVDRVEDVFCKLPTKRRVDVENMDTGELKAFARMRKLDLSAITEKSELQALVRGAKHEECGICMDALRAGQWVKTTWCGHEFHWACLGEAMLAKASTAENPRKQPVTCPYCATDLKRPPKPEPKTGHKRARHGDLFAHFFA